MQETSPFALQLHFLSDLRIWNDSPDPDPTPIHSLQIQIWILHTFLIIPGPTHIVKLNKFFMHIVVNQENL